MLDKKDFYKLSKEALNAFENINGFSNWESVYEIKRGWSNDKKYYVLTKCGEEMVLRVSHISNYDDKKKEFQQLKNIANLNINMSMPIQFGTCENNAKVYSLLTYVRGEDAESVLPTLSEREQYDLGVESGEFLTKIHSIEAPMGIINWSERFNKKIDRKITMYEQCEIKIPNGERIVEYLENNRDLLNNRNQTLHHGDYHVGNLIVTDDKRIGVIDFNRYDYGDPWEEFNRIAFSHRVSIPFAIGQLHGYFQGDPPLEFFKLLALYMGSNALSSVPWAIPFGEKEIEFMLGNANEMMSYYNNFETVIPTWYKSKVNYK